MWLYEKGNISLDDVETACCNNHVGFAAWLYSLLPIKDKTKAFDSACSHGSLDAAKWILSIPGDLNVRYENDSPFRYACSNGHLDVAKWLLEIQSDIDVHAEDDDAFCSAVHYGHDDVAEWLYTLPGDLVVRRIHKGVLE